MKYLDILDCSIADGEGVRVALYVSGCDHKCKGCHNPESWDSNNGKEFTEETKDTLFKLLDRDYIDGITLSGGDPLYCSNYKIILNLCLEIRQKFPTKTIWLYTGFKYEEIQRLDIVKYIDVLVEGPYVEELRDITLPFRGSSNQRIIKLKG